MRQQRWRLIILGILIAAPAVFLMGYGAWKLWDSGLSFWAWWPMSGSLALAYLLAWRWQKKQRLLTVEGTVPLHWTDRDRTAWVLVEARAKTAAKLPAEKLTDLQQYLEIGQEMALELARFYNPRAKDPVGSLTIPELLAVVELASGDLADMVNQYLPAGHLMTLNNWRQAKQAADWYQVGSAVYWMVSALFSPINTGLRYAASQAGISRPLQMLQENLLLWFYTAYLHRLGHYLIEVNSGRLRVGAKRYRTLLQESRQAEGAVAKVEPASEVKEGLLRVTFTILGQVKVGKSSLINALLGEQRAQTGVLPLTDEITRYELEPKGVGSRLDILDTVGYGNAGPRQDQLKATHEAARTSELLLLVLHARNPARQADLEMLKALKAWFETHPELKLPPILAVLTHIDLLSPSLEWAPPYDWQKPRRPKEQQIEQAVAAVREQLGDYLAGIVPVCTAEGKVYGIQEWLLPAVAQLLDDARAVALLRCLRNEADAGKVRKVLDQLLAAGKQAVKILLHAPPARH